MLSNLNEEYKNKLEIIKNHFGEEHQYRKLLEEIEEFNGELETLYFKDDKGFTDIFTDSVFQDDKALEKLLEEMVDCYVVAYQINKIEILEYILFLMFNYRYFDFGRKILPIMKGKDRILEIARQKIDRTLERIKSGYYEPDICPNCGGDGGFENPYEGGFFADCNVCNGTGKVERKEK